MDSTGSTGGPKEPKTGSKDGKRENTLPKEAYKYFPSIQEFSLNDKNNKKRLQYLFDAYLKPQ